MSKEKKSRIGDIVFFIVVAIVVAALSVGFAWEHNAKERAQADFERKDAQLQLLRDELDAVKYDTERISNWHDGSQGTVRVVEAKVVSQEEGIATVEDTEGEQWLVDSIDVTEDDELLLFIADNNTVDDKSDDVIIRLYTYRTLK